MNPAPCDGALPPRLDDVSRGAPPPETGRRRMAEGVALLLLAGYVLVPAVLGAGREAGDGAMLPTTTGAVLVVCAWELTLFAAVFGVVVWLGGLRGDDLWWRWRGGAWVVPRALAWSLALRFGLGVVLGLGVVVWQFLRGEPLADLEGMRPEVEALVDFGALRDPVYLVLMMTLVSFVLAGLREELWRAGMIALLGRAWPGGFGGRWGPWLAVLPVALLFGLAHSPQGIVGVLATTLLGVGLGAILLYHRSLWEAVLAHGFFNATTFAILPWLADRYPHFLA